MLESDSGQVKGIMGNGPHSDLLCTQGPERTPPPRPPPSHIEKISSKNQGDLSVRGGCIFYFFYVIQFI